MRNLISRFGLALLGLGITAFTTQAQFTLSSTVTYTGRQTGEVWIAPSANGSTLIMAKKIPLGALVNQPFTNAAFALPNLDDGATYHVFAWRDSNTNGVPDATEAQAWHPGNPFVMASNLTVAGFVITDPDFDADLRPDWWEVKYGLHDRIGTGRSGALTIQPGQTNYTDVVRANVIGSNPAGASTLNVSTTNGFSANDLVLIITMQDTNLNLAQNSAGIYEFGRIASLTQGGGITNLMLTAPRTNTFTPATSQRIQVLKVPEYTEVNLAGPALRFYGTNTVRVPGFGWVMPTNEVTIEVWVRIITNKYDWPTLVTTMPSENLNRLALGVGSKHSGGSLMWDFGDGWGLGRLSYHSGLGIGIWQHLAVVASQSGNCMKVFTNGVLEKSESHFDALERGDYLLEFGLSFVGEMAEVRIWNKARSQAEIQADMNRTLNGTEPELLAYYPLDEGAGTNVLDATGHGHNGTVVNGPTWVSSTLTCQPWNGTNGGVLAFLAHQVTLGKNSVISADGKGYRGGDSVAADGGDYAYGKAGERSTGFSSIREGNSLERPQGGGGAGRGADGSGGGGAYASSGTDGGKALSSSDFGRGATTTYGLSTLSRIFAGGGGGGSGSHTSSRVGVGGGGGGGVVFISAGWIQGSGMISSCGAKGLDGLRNTADVNQGSGGGGGAGGSVYLAGNFTSSMLVQATGGAGGARHPLASNSQDGGAGGVGRIRLDLPPDAIAPALDPPAGYVKHLPATNTLVWSPYSDTDQDGLSDLVEYQLDTNPVNADTDGDTLPDAWEVAYGLNPLNASDAASGVDRDSDGVSNLIEFQRGTRPDLADTDGDGLSDSAELFVHRTDPLRSDSDADGMNDTTEVLAGSDPLFSGIHYFYDSIDRLVGAQYENGLTLGYEYDRNNNLVRQFYSARDGNTNALPDLWEFLNRMTNNSSGFADTDGDGWSDYQEWQAGTSPTNAASAPNLTGQGSLTLASLQWPFTPSSFVVGVGQLDGLGAEEIFIGADGDPGNTTNFLFVLTQTNSGWSTQRVDLGPCGVTSIAVGHPANRPRQAIYVGLRQTGGTGRVVEFMPAGGVWSSNSLVTGNEAAFVLGVRANKDVVVSFAATNAPPGCPYYVSFGSAWTYVLANTNTSQRGLGAITRLGLPGLPSHGVRLLDAGGLQVIGEERLLPSLATNAIAKPDYSRWFFLTPSVMTWDNAQAYARQAGGNLATVSDGNLNTWLWNQYLGIGNYWIGLSRSNCSSPWQWVSGAPFVYANWYAGEPNCSGGTERMGGVLSASGAWNDWTPASTLRGVVEVGPFNGPSVSATEPPASKRLLWRGQSLNAGNLRLTDAVSILYTFVDDRNLNDLMDAGDEFVVAEYLFSGSTVAMNDLQRLPLSGPALAPSYGLTSVDVLYGNQQVFFTAEPDGRVFSWSATNAAAPLQRQLFSAQHTGKAWHALAGVKSLEAGQSLLGLRVEPTAPNRCDLILWPPQSALWLPTEVPQTAPITQVLPAPNWGRDIAGVDIRIWDAEGGPATPELVFQRTSESAWSNATIAVSGAINGSVTTSPIGLTNQVCWDAARDLGPGFTNTVQLRARARDISLTGDWSPPLTYTVQNSLTNHLWATDDVASTPMNTPVDIDVLANDNCSPKFIASLGVPAHGLAVTNNKTVHYTPAPGFVGTDQFTYTLTDGAGGFDLATVTVTVTAGEPPGILLDSPSLQSGNQFSMTVTGPAGTYEVIASTNLADWLHVSWATNTTGTLPFTEQVAPNARTRFYRAIRVE